MLSSNSFARAGRCVWVSKLLVAVIAGAILAAGVLNVGQFRDAFARYPEDGPPTFASGLSTWDVAHYLKLAEGGYKPGSRSCAFYPLWPAVIRLGTVLTGGRPVLAATLAANAFSLVALALFARWVERRFGPALSRDTLILMLAFPGALFFSFAYSESLYFLLLMAFFLCLDARRYYWVAAVSFLLPLARPVGVFILAPLAWWLWEQIGVSFRRQPKQASAEEPAKPFGRFAPWLLLAFPLLGYASYFGLMHLWTGNAFEGFEAQKSYPNSPSIMNMFNVAGFWNAFTNIGTLDGMMDSALDRLSFLMVLALLPLIYRLDKVWFWYVLPAGVVPALTSWFMSYRRYTMVLFPVFIILARLISKTRSRWVFWYYVAILAALQAWAIKQFVTFNWAG